MSGESAVSVDERQSLKHVLVVANGKAGEGSQLDGVTAALAELGVAVELAFPESIEEMRTLVGEARQRFDVVAIAGGDGTLHSAIPALRGKGAPLAILPRGTANDLARTLGIPLDPVEAARLIVDGRARAIDLGWVNGRAFFNVAHVGLGARAKDQLTAERKARFGVLGYPVALFRALRRLRPFRVCIVAGGRRRWLLAVDLAVGNGRYFGGGVPVDGNASAVDGVLSVYCIRASNLAALFGAGGAVWLGTPGNRQIWRASAPRLTVWTRRRRRITGDGETLGYTPARFRVEPGAIECLVPRDDAG